MHGCVRRGAAGGAGSSQTRGPPPKRRPPLYSRHSSGAYQARSVRPSTQHRHRAGMQARQAAGAGCAARQAATDAPGQTAHNRTPHPPRACSSVTTALRSRVVSSTTDSAVMSARWPHSSRAMAPTWPCRAQAYGAGGVSRWAAQHRGGTHLTSGMAAQHRAGRRGACDSLCTPRTCKYPCIAGQARPPQFPPACRLHPTLPPTAHPPTFMHLSAFLRSLGVP